VPDVSKLSFPLSLTKHLADTRTFEQPTQLMTPDHSWIDLEAIEPPDASMAAIQEAAELRVHEMRSAQIDVLKELLAETRASVESDKKALEVSEQALAATKSSKRAGWFACWAAFGAVLVGTVGML